MQGGSRRRRQLEQTRDDILEATRSVLVHAGYGGSRIEDICARAGVSRGAFYHHFPSKDGAIVALLEREILKLVELHDLVHDATEGDPARHVAMSIALTLRYAEANAPLARAYFIDMLGVPDLQDLQRRIDRVFEAQILLDLSDAFPAVSVEPSATVRAAMGAAKETAIAWLKGGVPDLDTALRELVRFVLMGLGVARDRAAALAEEAALFRLGPGSPGVEGLQAGPEGR